MLLDFLSAMFEKGHAYSTINSAKCAITTIIHIPPYESLNKHLLINKYMTGIFNLRPIKPKLSLDIMRRWIKDITVNNIVNFSPHSCRAAYGSKAKQIDVTIDEITRRGCWKNWKNFLTFYNKEITEYALEDRDFNRICKANYNA